MTARHLKSVPAVGLAVLLLAAATPSAAAASGSYTVTACSPTTSPGAWQQINTFPGGITSATSVAARPSARSAGATPAPFTARNLIGSTAHSPSGAQAGWSFTAPAGTTITAVSYYRSLETGNDLDWVAGLLLNERHAA